MQLVGRAVPVVVSQGSWLLQAHAPYPEAAPCSAAQLPPHSLVPFSAELRHPSGCSPSLLLGGVFRLGKAHLDLASALCKPGLGAAGVMGAQLLRPAPCVCPGWG